MQLPQKSDYSQWLQLRTQSKEFLTPFEPKWPQKPPSRTHFARRVKNYAEIADKKTGFSFFIFDTSPQPSSPKSEQLVGGITLSNIRYRAANHANLGYWLGYNYVGKNYMGRAMNLCLSFAFESLKLQRIHAACLPHNQNSIKVLTKSGFVKEGFAEEFLQIGGTYQDHNLYGLTATRYATIKGN
ncbi:MAG: GNAT family N-acetyltransferase [Devosiaceae bacterium]|nr:GNAT family N-acetyltransferase [Devosiaceae bacterium]